MFRGRAACQPLCRTASMAQSVKGEKRASIAASEVRWVAGERAWEGDRGARLFGVADKRIRGSTGRWERVVAVSTDVRRPGAGRAVRLSGAVPRDTEAKRGCAEL